MSFFTLDTLAWLAEHRRQNAVLIEAATAVVPRPTKTERPAPVLQAELICC